MYIHPMFGTHFLLVVLLLINMGVSSMDYVGKGLFELDTLVPQMERHLKGREKMKEKEKTTVNSLVDFLY